MSSHSTKRRKTAPYTAGEFQVYTTDYNNEGEIRSRRSSQLSGVDYTGVFERTSLSPYYPAIPVKPPGEDIDQPAAELPNSSPLARRIISPEDLTGLNSADNNGAIVVETGIGLYTEGYSARGARSTDLPPGGPDTAGVLYKLNGECRLSTAGQDDENPIGLGSQNQRTQL